MRLGLKWAASTRSEPEAINPNPKCKAPLGRLSSETDETQQSHVRAHADPLRLRKEEHP